MKKRSAWEKEDRKESWRIQCLFDPFFVDGMPSNEERLYHLDFYTKANDTAPIVRGGNKQGEGKLKEEEREWVEEHSVEFENVIFPREGIRKTGV